VAAKLGITGDAPAFAVGRNYDDFGIEAVPGAGHKAFEGALVLHVVGRAGWLWRIRRQQGPRRGDQALSEYKHQPSIRQPSNIPPSSSADNKDLGEAIEAFLKAEKVPAFLEFSQQTSQAIFGSGIPHQVGC